MLLTEEALAVRRMVASVEVPPDTLLVEVAEHLAEVEESKLQEAPTTREGALGIRVLLAEGVQDPQRVAVASMLQATTSNGKDHQGTP